MNIEHKIEVTVWFAELDIIINSTSLGIMIDPGIPIALRVMIACMLALKLSTHGLKKKSLDVTGMHF